MNHNFPSNGQQGSTLPARSSTTWVQPGARQTHPLPRESVPVPESSWYQSGPSNQRPNRYNPGSSNPQYAPSHTHYQPRQPPVSPAPPRVGTYPDQFGRTQSRNNRFEAPPDPTLVQQNAAREELYKTVNTAREYMTNNTRASGNLESRDQFASRIFKEVSSQLSASTTPSTASSHSTFREPPRLYSSSDSDGSGGSDSDDSPTVYRGKTPQRAPPYTPEPQRPLDPRVLSPGTNSQFFPNDQIYRSGVSSPNAFSSPLWSPDTRPDSQRTTLVSPGATTSPQITPNSRISPTQSVMSTVNGKLRSSYGSGGAEKSQSILERMERFVTTHKTMQEKAAFKYQDIYLTQTNGRKPDKEPEVEAWSEDGPSSSSDSEEDNHQSSFYDSRSHSSGPRVDHGYSSQGLQQATHGFSQLQITAGEHPSNTSNPTEPPIEAEYENEEEDDPPDLSGTVKLLSRHPIFSGTYSSVYEGVWEDRHVAVKVIRAVGSLKATRRKYRREAQVWSRLSHPNILPLYGLCMDSDFGPFGALISPWCKNGNSAESVHEIRSPADRIRLLLGVANGVRYLHEHVDRLVHGDLKPANILIDDDGVARLCDFGLVRLIQETPSGMTTTTAHTGTVRYLAQELVISDDPKPTTETDCHALGCIALEFAYLHPPYAHRGSTAPAGQFYMDISRGVPPSHRPELVESLDWGHSLLWDLFEACWDPEPQRRPSSTRIYNYLIENETVIVAALNSCIDIF